MDLRIHSQPFFWNTPDPNATRRPETTPPSSAPQTSPASPTGQASRPEGVTQEEWAWIQRHFPPSEKMTLRLYGPNRTLQTLRPGGLGTRLDVKG